MSDEAPLTESQLLLREAEWVWSEMEDFVRLVQRYRALYVTALFLSIGWSLGQALGVQRVAGNDSGDALLALRNRQDIAAILCVVPMLNGVFFILMMEAARQIQSLARYRFLLGIRLGRGEPVWRWELWKTTSEGTIRSWTNPSNVFLGVLAALITVGSFVFPYPAVRASGLLQGFWWTSLLFVVSLVVAVVIAGWKRRNDNDVADPPVIKYESLWPPPRR